MAPSARVGHQRFPTWHTLWAQINRRVSRLVRIYAGTHDIENTGELEDEVDALLLCIANLRDWMIAELGVDQSLKQQIKEMTGHDPLGLCHDYANTFKHHTRRSGRRYARLHETAAGPCAVTVSLRHWKGDEAEQYQSTDALTFAQECIAEWRRFLAAHGIEDPQPS